MYQYKNGVIDTTNVYRIAPRYTKKVMTPKDTTVLFFNKEKEFVIRIDKDSLKYYIIKK
jgi:hypothetical protein